MWSVWTRDCIKNEVIECTDFLHAGGNSGKLKVISVILGGHGENRRGDLSTLDPKILVRPTSYSISLTFKCHSTAIVLVRPLALAGRTL